MEYPDGPQPRRGVSDAGCFTQRSSGSWSARSPIFTSFTTFTYWCYDRNMKRATITFPEDLAEAVEQYLKAQETRPAMTTVVQAALREYLQGRGFLRGYRPLKLRPLGNSGRSDVSANHDL